MLSLPLVLLLNKPKGITSHTAIKQVQKKVHCKKIGHCGTLDKFASGLLIVLLNKATRLSQFFLALPKVYIAEICFGKTTDTLDPEGTIIGTSAVPQLEEIKKALSVHFTGTILQKPPQYSAVHVNGERAYKRVKKGEQITMSPRKIEVFSYSIIDYKVPKLTVSLHVSSGTYIRSIAYDLARYCNSVAYVSYLERCSIAGLALQESCSLSSVTASLGTTLSQNEYISKQPCNRVNENINTATKQPSGMEFSFVMSPDVALEKIHTLTRCYTDATVIREKVAMGVMPDSILKDSVQTQAEFVSLHDMKGLIGIWKTKPKCKLVC